MPERLSFRETFALYDPQKSLKEIVLMLKGEPGVPKSKFDLSSAKRLYPATAFGIWRKWFLHSTPEQPQIALISNMFNHTPTPIEEGWSVRVTQVRDFAGLGRTYDSHNGTDFAVRPGTTVVATAPGRVCHIVNEYNRGGLKVMLEHGGNLITTYHHLSKVLVTLGQEVTRGEPIALSGYSGADGLLTFPFGIPHVHVNTLLNGVAVDPFAQTGEVSLWINHNHPIYFSSSAPAIPSLPESQWDPKAIADALLACNSKTFVSHIKNLSNIQEQGVQLVAQQMTYPGRFSQIITPYASVAPRAPYLDFPFLPEEVSGFTILN